MTTTATDADDVGPAGAIALCASIGTRAILIGGVLRAAVFVAIVTVFVIWPTSQTHTITWRVYTLDDVVVRLAPRDQISRDDQNLSYRLNDGTPIHAWQLAHLHADITAAPFPSRFFPVAWRSTATAGLYSAARLGGLSGAVSLDSLTAELGAWRGHLIRDALTSGGTAEAVRPSTSGIAAVCLAVLLTPSCIVVARLLRRTHLQFIRARDFASGRSLCCIRCAYELTSRTERCPECGWCLLSDHRARISGPAITEGCGDRR